MSPPGSPIKSNRLMLTGAAMGLLAGLIMRPDHDSSVVIADRGSEGARPSRPGPPGHRQGLPQTEARLEVLRNAGPPSRQIAVALAFAEINSVEEIRDLLKNSHRFPSHSAEDVAIGTLLKRWLELDAPGAVEYCHHHQSAMLPQLLATWHMEHSAEATAWVRAMPPGGVQKEAWLALCTAEGARDPDKAWNMIAGTPGFDPGSSWDMVPPIRELVGRDVEKAITRLDSVPPAIVSAVQTSIAAQLMKTDPERAWAWARQLLHPIRASLAVLDVSITSDPAHALVLMRSLPATELLRIASDLQGEVTNRNAPEFTALLRQETGIPEATRQKIAESLFRGYIWEDPKAALDLISLMSSEGQITSIRNSVENWSSQDPADAAAWVANLPEGPLRTAATEALDSLAQTKRAADAGSTESLLADLKRGLFFSPTDPRLSQLDVEQVTHIMGGHPADGGPWDQIFSNLVAANPDVIATWLQSQKVDSQNGPRAAQFSSQWAQEDPMAAAAWAAKLPAGELSRIAAANIAVQFYRYAPRQAEDWAAKLPAGPVQDIARHAMTAR